jgi:hypothetical protein
MFCTASARPVKTIDMSAATGTARGLSGTNRKCGEKHLSPMLFPENRQRYRSNPSGRLTLPEGIA